MHARVLLFISASIALGLTPGPDMFYVLARTLGQGRRAGIVSACGMFLGMFVPIVLAALGVAALVASSRGAFVAVKTVGGLYLLWLGVRSLIAARRARTGAAALTAEPLRRVFVQGFVSTVLNPKVALFIFAFLPQFVDPRAGSVVLQTLGLGMIFNTAGAACNMSVALGANAIATRLSGTAAAHVGGFVLVVLGALLLLAR
jgi:threonine/homoserine/homoserine lactone efflux protein